MRRYACTADPKHLKWKTIEAIEMVYDDLYVKEQQVANGKRLGERRSRREQIARFKAVPWTAKPFNASVRHVAGEAGPRIPFNEIVMRML